MAKLVAAAGTPHGPMLPQQVAEAPGQLRAEALMQQVREQLEESAPDIIIEVASDHFTNFFYNNLPQFCVGAMPEAEGPAETYCVMPHRVVLGHPDLAKKVLSFGLKSGFDLAISEEFRLDHSVLVPLHFLTPSMDIPVVPLYVNGLAPPLPLARRCYALGQALRRFIDQWDSNQRVALLASGSFSLEVGGPRVGYTDKDWVTTVSSLLEQGNYRGLARRATEQRMASAGNVSGELLCWIAVAGALGETRPLFVEIEQGGGFAFWEFSEQP
jgi:hypothetical protein